MFLKNKNIILKIRRSKVTDYAALIIIVNSYNSDLIAISLILIKISINRTGCGL